MGALTKTGTLISVSLLIGCGQCISLLGALSPSIHPTNVNQALMLFDYASHRGNFLQAQRALDWIKSHYVEVLRSPDLADVSFGCLMQILSQPAYIDEIEVFRAVKRLIQTPHSQSRFNVPMLLSTVRLASIDIEKLQNEVASSGIWPQHSVMDAVLKAQLSPIPKEYTRRSPGDGTVLAPLGNIVGAEFNAKIVTPKSSYTISSQCNGKNPLVPSNRRSLNSNTNCFIESQPSEYITMYLGGQFPINYIRTYTPSERRCPKLRLEVSQDNHHFTPAGIISNAYSGDSVKFGFRLVSYIRYRSDPCTYSNGTAVTGLRLISLEASLN